MTAFTNFERTKLRKAIVRHPDWSEYARARGINSAKLSSSAQVAEVARALGVDMAAVLNSDAEPAPSPSLDWARPEAMPTRRRGAQKPNIQEDESVNTSVAPAASAPQPMGVDAVIQALVAAEVKRLAATLQPAEAASTIVRVQVNTAPPQEIQGSAHAQLEDLLFSFAARDAGGMRQNVMVFGGRGRGKSKAARQVAEALGLDFYLHGKMEFAHDVLGYVNPVSGEYHETPFVKAYRDGGLVLCDEVDRWDPNAQTALNGALSDGEMWLPNGEKVARHPDCAVMAAANTRGTGGDRKYVGANRLDAAFLDRFAIKIEWELDLSLEAKLLGDTRLHKHVKHARGVLLLNDIDAEITTRHALAMRDLIAAGATLQKAAQLTYRADMTADQLEVLDNA